MYDRYLAQNDERILDRVLRFIEIPSVSITGEGMDAAVSFLHRELASLGFEPRVHETPGYPIVTAEAGPEAAPFTLLIYGHYDVFPSGREEDWTTDPFTPVIDGDRLYGRGAGDNKGQIMAHLLAIDMFRQLHGELPVKVKLVVEGEEETGSKSLPGFIAEHREALAADLCVYSDGPMFPGDQPVLLFGVRGALCMEIEARGARRVLHSGNFGGVAPKPTLELCRLLSAMVTADGELRLPGANDGVPELTAVERQALSRLPLDLEQIRDEMGTEPICGDGAAAFYERLLCRPSFNVASLSGGPAGDGFRAVIADRATAKVDIRLVGDQDPDRLYRGICDFIRDRGLDRITCKKLIAQPPSKTPIDHPFSVPVQEAVAKGFGKRPLLVPGLGGTTPDYVFTKLLGIPSIVVPYAPYDENNHAPNESTKLSLLFNGIKTTAHLLEAFQRCN